MAFKDDFLKIVHGEPSSLYSGFVKLSREALPSDADDRYQYLRSPQGKFIARDEADVDVYTVRVAHKHVEKFRWLYDGLYTSYPEVFSKDIDVVVWGCGCGLDLLALYDRACAQNNPQLWMKVRSVTLVDASAAALKRASEIAKILFPFANANIQSIRCDLTDPATVMNSVRLRQLTAYVSRVHLISNLLDLFNDVIPFATAVKQCSARRIGGYSYYNELVVAFSPEYRGGRVAHNIDTFRKTWGDNAYAEDIKAIGNEPMNCESCSFAYRTLVGDRCYRSYMSGKNHVLNTLVAKCPLVEPGFDFAKFVSALRLIKINGVGFFKVYRWAETCRYHDSLTRVVFVPDPAITPRPSPLAIEIVPSGSDNVSECVEKSASRALKCLKDKRGDDATAIGGKESDFAVMFWDGSDLKTLPGRAKADVMFCDGVVDYSLYFRIDPGDAEPLPDLDNRMDETQRELIYSRAQYRKVRGGAGCGKSTTMMWHAIMSVLRTHMPSLLVCKTVTLFSRNERRMAATLLQKVEGLDYVDADLVRFMTLDRVLCEHTSEVDRKCLITKCAKCKGCNDSPKWDCRSAEYVGQNWRQLDEQTKKKCCEKCVEENLNRFARKGTRSAALFKAYGAVLIDEVQSVSPALVQAVVNLTYGGNPVRECYAFCDERQSLNAEAVEVDAEVGKYRVRIPDRGEGYGRWVNLNKPYRTSLDLSGRLSDVATKLQALTIEKYGAVELARIVDSRQLSLTTSVFSIRMSSGDLVPELQQELQSLLEEASGSVTIICDDVDDVRNVLRDPCAAQWKSTHCAYRNRSEEQRRRMTFREQDSGVQLTTVTLAQGWDFKNVIFVMNSELDGGPTNVMENVLTGATRATAQMRILDRSKSGWLYRNLRELNN